MIAWPPWQIRHTHAKFYSHRRSRPYAGRPVAMRCPTCPCPALERAAGIKATHPWGWPGTLCWARTGCFGRWRTCRCRSPSSTWPPRSCTRRAALWHWTAARGALGRGRFGMGHSRASGQLRARVEGRRPPAAPRHPPLLDLEALSPALALALLLNLLLLLLLLLHLRGGRQATRLEGRGAGRRDGARACSHRPLPGRQGLAAVHARSGPPLGPGRPSLAGPGQASRPLIGIGHGVPRASLPRGPAAVPGALIAPPRTSISSVSAIRA